MLKVYCRSSLNADLSDVPLSEYRRRKMQSAKPQDKLRCGLCLEALLNRAARDNLDGYEIPVSIVTNENGKPYLSDNAMFFSLSDTDTFCICAVSDSEIGADVQKIVGGREKLAERFFSEEEIKLIKNSENHNEMFSLLWALKESYIKFLGLGLSKALNSFSVIPNNDGTAVLSGTEKCRFFWRRWEDRYISICTEKSTEKPEYIFL